MYPAYSLLKCKLSSSKYDNKLFYNAVYKLFFNAAYNNHDVKGSPKSLHSPSSRSDKDKEIVI